MPDPGKLLVANIGSTSFKFRLFEMPSEKVLASGGFERIGSSGGTYKIRNGDSPTREAARDFADYGECIRLVEEELGGFDDLAAVAFKPVMAKGVSGTQYMDESVLEAMEEISGLVPAHNPPYIAGVRFFHQLYPSIPCIGTFETAFYDHIPIAQRRYPIPVEWEKKYGVARYGFHGASHRYVSQRCAELRETNELRIISCHLGGSSSMAAVLNGIALDSSWGMSPQTGLPHNNRTGDFDCFAMIYLARECGLGWEKVEKALSSEAGLKGMSGLNTGDMRDVREAAAAGNEDAQIAYDVLITSIRRFIGRFLVELNGLDVLIFTAGIGENDSALRSRVCSNLDFLGLKLDEQLNASTHGVEQVISAPDSKVEVRVIPTNEEIVIARNAWQLLHTT